MASVAVGLRLRREVWERHAAAAQTLGVPLSAYLRQRLDEQDLLAEELGALRAALERNAGSEATGGGPPPFAAGVLVELLLLLRILAGPQKAAVAQKEVERRGLETWR
jgi:hypothetical protein